MGAWGHSAFENDDALDWLYELEESSGLDLVVATLTEVSQEGDYLEAPESSMGLAAAEVVAALNGQPAEDLPENVAEWCAALGEAADQDLVALAASAVRIVAGGSELKELWEEADNLDAFLQYTNDLLARIESA